MHHTVCRPIIAVGWMLLVTVGAGCSAATEEARPTEVNARPGAAVEETVTLEAESRSGAATAEEAYTEFLQGVLTDDEDRALAVTAAPGGPWIPAEVRATFFGTDEAVSGPAVIEVIETLDTSGNVPPDLGVRLAITDSSGSKVGEIIVYVQQLDAADGQEGRFFVTGLAMSL